MQPDRLFWTLIVVLVQSRMSQQQKIKHLDCKTSDIIRVQENMTVNYSTRGYYARTCNWIFNSEKRLRLKFKEMTIGKHWNGCTEYMTVTSASKNVTNVCQIDKNVVFEGNEISVNLRLANYLSSVTFFTATVGVDITSDLHVCDYGTGTANLSSDGGLVLVHKFEPRTEVGLTKVLTGERGRNLAGTILRDIRSLEAMTTGTTVGASVCYRSHVMMPMSDTPSCHADAPDTCKWYSTAPSIKMQKHYISNVQGNVFNVMKWNGTFTSHDLTPRLINVCLHVEYLPGTSGRYSLTVLHGHSEETNLHTAYFNESKQWRVDKVMVNVPAVLQQIKRLKLHFYVTSVDKNSSTLVKRLYGCNPHSMVDRFLLPINGSKTTSVSINVMEELNIEQTRQVEEQECLNRGLSTVDGCRCNVGLYGKKCEKVCRSNRFGANCEAKCSSKSTKCQAMVFCSPGMGCHCAPGWKGDTCNTICSHGEYGVDCREDCGRCLRNSTCSRYSGVCTEGCQPGYVPPHCNSRYAHLTKTAEVKILNLTWVEIGVDYSPQDINGSGDTKFYLVQYKQIGDGPWTDGVPTEIPADHSIRRRVDGLTPGTSYHARIILLDERMNAYAGEDLPTIGFQTDCNDNPINITATEITASSFKLSLQLTSQDFGSCRIKDYSVDVSSGFTDWRQTVTCGGEVSVGGLAPDTKYTVLVRQVGNRTVPMPSYSTYVTTQPSQEPVEMEVFNVTSRGLKIRWDEPNREITYTIVIQCLRAYLLPAANQRECTTDERQTSVTVTGPGVHNLDINNLRPFTRYSVKIGHSPDAKFSEVKETTDFAFEGKALDAKLVNVTQTTATVEWNDIEECEICNLFTDGYLVQIKDNVTGAMKAEVFTHQNNVTFRGLQPANEYTVSVHFVNKNKTIISEPAVAKVLTKPSVPSPVLDLVAYKKSRHTVGLRWSTPEHVYGEISSFAVYSSGERRPAIVSPPVMCPMWPRLYCYTVEGLQPDRSYNFTVTARNDMLDEDGEPAYATAQTEECAPDAPTEVRVESVSETSASVSWGPPNMLNGVLRSFLIKIEQIDSYNASYCCNYYPKIDILVQEERQRFDTKISGLTGASTYALSMMAETAWLGPAAKIELSTRPPRPASVVLPVDLTTIRLVASPEDEPHSVDIVWPSQHPSEPNAPHLPTDKNLLLLVPGAISDDEAKKNVSIDSGDLANLVRQEVGDDFDVLALYEGASPSVDVNTVVPEVNMEYRLVAVSAVRYRDVYNIRTLSSQPFSLSMDNTVAP